MRISFAFVIISLFAFIRHGWRAFAIDRKTLFLCILLGLVSQGVFNICYTASIRMNGMGIACVLMYTAPVFTAIASRIIFGEHFTRRKIFALLLNIFGCILTVTGGDISAERISLMGILAGLYSGFGYGMAAVIGRKAGEHTDALTMSVYSYLAAAVFLYVFLRPDLSPMTNMKVPVLGFLYALIPTALAYVVYYSEVSRIQDTSKVPVVASIEPVVAVFLGTQVYGEAMGMMNYLGVAVVLASIVIIINSRGYP